MILADTSCIFHVYDFVVSQFEAIKKYIEGGGSVLVLMGEGGETKYQTNINYLLEEYGIYVNSGMFSCCN
jgi:hypothetical protein